MTTAAMGSGWCVSDRRYIEGLLQCSRYLLQRGRGDHERTRLVDWVKQWCLLYTLSFEGFLELQSCRFQSFTILVKSSQTVIKCTLQLFRNRFYCHELMYSNKRKLTLLPCAYLKYAISCLQPLSVCRIPLTRPCCHKNVYQSVIMSSFSSSHLKLYEPCLRVSH